MGRTHFVPLCTNFFFPKSSKLWHQKTGFGTGHQDIGHKLKIARDLKQITSGCNFAAKLATIHTGLSSSNSNLSKFSSEIFKEATGRI